MAGRRRGPSVEARGHPGMPRPAAPSGSARIAALRNGQSGTNEDTQAQRQAVSAGPGLASSRYSNDARNMTGLPLRAAPSQPRGRGGSLGLARSVHAETRDRRSGLSRGSNRDDPSQITRGAQVGVASYLSRNQPVHGRGQASTALLDRTNSSSRSSMEGPNNDSNPDAKYLALRAEDFVVANNLPVLVNEPAPWQPLQVMNMELQSSSKSPQEPTFKLPRGKPIWEVDWHQDTVPVNGIIPESARKDPKSRPPLEVQDRPSQPNAPAQKESNCQAQSTPAIPRKSRQRRPVWEEYVPVRTAATGADGSSMISSDTQATRVKFDPSRRAPNQTAKAMSEPEHFETMSSKDKVAFEMKYQVWSNFALDIGEHHHGLSRALVDQIGRSGCLNRSWPPLRVPSEGSNDLPSKSEISKRGEERTQIVMASASKGGELEKRTSATSSPLVKDTATRFPLLTNERQPSKILQDTKQISTTFGQGIASAPLATSDVPRLGASTRPAATVKYATMGESIHAPHAMPAQEISIDSTLAGDKLVAWAAARNATKSSRRDARAERQEQNRRGIVAMKQTKSASTVPGIANNLQAASEALSGLGGSKYARTGVADASVSSTTARGETKLQARSGTLTPTQATWESRAGSQQGINRINVDRASRAYHEETAALRARGVKLTVEFISGGGLQNDNDNTPTAGSPCDGSPGIDDAAFWDQPIHVGESAGVDEYVEPGEDQVVSRGDESPTSGQQEDIEIPQRCTSPLTVIFSPQTSSMASTTASLDKENQGTGLGQPAENKSIALHLPKSSIERALNIASQSTPRHPSASSATSKRVTRSLQSSSGANSTRPSDTASAVTSKSSSTSISSALRNPFEAAHAQDFPAIDSSPQPRLRAQRRFARQSTHPPIAESSYLGSSQPSSQPLHTISEGGISTPQPNFPPRMALEVELQEEPPYQMPELPSHNLAVSVDGSGFPDHSSKPYLPKEFQVNYQISNGALYSIEDKDAFENALGRTIVLFNLPLGFTAAEVVSMVWGGPLEAVFMLPDKDYVSIIFLHVADCDRYAKSLPKAGIPFPGQPERMIKYMRRGEHDPHHPDLASWAKAGATRCLRIISIPNLVTIENMLHLLQGRWKEKEQTYERPLEWMLARAASDLCSHVLFDFCQEGSFPMSEQWMVSVRFTELRHALDVIWLIHCVPEWTAVLEAGYILVDWLEDVTTSSSDHPRNPDYFGRHEKVFPVPAVYGYIPAGFDMAVAVEVCDVRQPGEEKPQYTEEDIESLAPVWPGDTHAAGERALMHGYVMLANRRDPGYVGIEDQEIPKHCAEGLARGRGASF